MNITHTLSLPALTVTLMLFISGCQITNNKLASNISYGEYYLTLQQLTEIQLMEEVNKLQANINTISAQPSTPDYDSQIKLLLLYSLPKSPIYNSFNAKALLNQMKQKDNNAAFANINPSEQAFITLLRDQLNQRLLMRNRLLLQQQEQQKLSSKKQQQLREQIALLEQTIFQLKKIDQAIDKREQ
mgnify:CR=1 FL=1